MSYKDRCKDKKIEPVFIWKKLPPRVPAYSFETILEYQQRRKKARSLPLLHATLK